MRVIAVTFLALLAGCIRAPVAATALSDAESVAVLVASRVLNAISDQDYKVIDVSVQGADAATVLARSRPHAKKFILTSGERFAIRDGRLVHQRTGSIGAVIVFVVSEVSLSAATVRILWSGSYGETSTQRYSLRKEAGTWTIEARIVESIS